MKLRSKKYVEASKKIDSDKLYSKEEAIKLAKETATTSFDSTVDISIKLNIDAKKSDQQLRGSLTMPNGTGKSKKVLVIAKEAMQEEAKKAGADFVGGVELLNKIKEENWFDFDVMVATPDMMPTVGRLGRILGPKGLMPNPKTGTVTMNVSKAVKDAKSGKVTYRTDRDGNVAVIIGKVSFDAPKLVENFKTIENVIAKNRPASVKGDYVKNISISSTFGPGVKVALSSF